ALKKAEQGPVLEEAAVLAGIKGTLTKDDPLDTFPPTSKSHRRVHTVKLAAGKRYQIDLASLQFDTYLRVEDKDGKLLAYNDDVSPPKGLASRLISAPPAAGPYRLIVTSFQGGATGPYLLRAAEVQPAGKPSEQGGELTDKDKKGEGRFAKVLKVELAAG